MESVAERFVAAEAALAAANDEAIHAARALVSSTWYEALQSPADCVGVGEQLLEMELSWVDTPESWTDTDKKIMAAMLHCDTSVVLGAARRMVP